MSNKNFNLLKDNVKISFLKAKKEILDLKLDIKETKNLILDQKNELEDIKRLILQNNGITEPKSLNTTKSSTGNKGVPMRYLCVSKWRKKAS